MRRDSGIVLINALVIVLAISTVAAALLTRAEGARVRAVNAQGAQQLALYLDGIELLLPALLKATAEGGAVHPGQPWAQAGLRYPIDRGAVAVRIDDLQGRLNVNWLMHADPYMETLFAQVFAALGVPQSLLREITDFVSPSGPRATSGYLSRIPPVLPRGGPVGSVDELREVQGMTPAYFATLRPLLAALPGDSRLNLNTAPQILLKTALAPFPPEQITEILSRDKPILAMSEIRRRTVEILETEEIDDLPFDRLTIGSNWFQADLTAVLDTLQQRRQAVFLVQPATAPPIRLMARWAVYD